MKRPAEQRRSPVRIELTALVDVVLLLLIFFMVSARLVPEFGIELELPEAQAASRIESDASELHVLVDSRDRYFMTGEQVTIAALEAKLEVAKATEVVIEADTAASHGAVMRVLDAAKMAGLESVRISADARAGLSETLE